MADHSVTTQDIAQAYVEGDRVVWGGQPGTVAATSAEVTLDNGHRVVVPARALEHVPVEGGVQGVEYQWVLSWVPLVAPDDGMILVDGAPVEIPLNEHWVMPSGAIGEFRLSTREVPGVARG